MYRTLTDSKLLCGLTHCRIVIYNVFGYFYGSFFYIAFQRKSPAILAQLGEEVSVKKQELQNVTIEKELAEEATQKANEERTIAQKINFRLK